MKKRIITLACVLLSAALCFSGCGYPDQRIENPQKDFDYVVYSNGGSAVQYGEYVYFINGLRGYADEDAKQNVFGNVVKGGIYRAKLNVEASKRVDGDKNIASVGSAIMAKDADGNPIAGMPLTEMLFDFEIAAEGRLKFADTINKYGKDFADLEITDEEEELGEKIDWVKNVAVAPKTAGTAGYAQGGIFIFDEYLYFATPNNEKNRSGVVQSTHTEFWRMHVSGKDVRKILTTKGVAESTPYGFYKSGDSVYLVCSYQNEDGKLDVVSVRMKGTTIYKAMYLTQEANNVYIPVRDTYDKNNSAPIGLGDFVFYTRDVKEGDKMKRGNLIEVTSPDGAERFSFAMTGNDKPTQIEDVRDGLIFYTAQTEWETTEVQFSNLHDMLMMPETEIEGESGIKVQGSKRYQDYEAQATVKRGQVSGTVFGQQNFDSYHTKYYYRQNPFDSHAYMLGFSDSGVFRLTTVGAESAGVKILSSSPELLMVKGQYMYYLQGAAIWRTDIFKTAAEKAAASPTGEEGEQLTDRDVVTAGTFRTDIVAGHLVFFAAYDEWTQAGTAYTFFKKLRPGSVSFMIGTLAEEDYPTAEQLADYFGLTDHDDHDGHDHG
ncbi:MAG: hypothetical protein FWD58_02020 [Firmicutes bacterium]|nr:hypothetical protein [Bacillota bacterium]